MKYLSFFLLAFLPVVAHTCYPESEKGVRFNLAPTEGQAPGTVFTGTDYWGRGPLGNSAIEQRGGRSVLVVTESGTLRSGRVTAAGTVKLGAYGVYSRIITRDALEPPYEFGGDILIRSRLDRVWIETEQREPTWKWGVNFHPAFVDEDNNIVSGFAPNGKDRWSASGQINGPYGIARAYTYLPTGFDHDAQLGEWHTFRLVVPSKGHHIIYWDGVKVYEVIEKLPGAPWWDRPLHAGLRLDFYDFELRNLYTLEHLGHS